MPERARRRQRLRLTIGLLGLVLCAVCMSTAFAAYASAVGWVRHTLEVEQRASAWIIGMRDADALLRAYVQSPRPEVRDEMERVLAEQAGAAEDLRRLTADNPAQGPNVDRAEQQAAAAVARMRATLSMAEREGPGEAVALDAGEKVALSAFRSAVESIRGEEGRLLEMREAELHRRKTLSLAGLFLFGIATAYVSLAAWRARSEADTIAAVADAQRTLAEERAAAIRFQDTFVAILGHDLRNPLNAIGMAQQLIEKRAGPSPELAVPLQRMKSSCARMRRMIDQILDFARARLGGGIPVARKEMNLAAVVEQIVGESRMVNPGRTIELAESGDLHGRWDPDRVAQVISNLVGNGIVHGSDDPVSIAVSGSDHDVAVEVSNRGEIPLEARDTVFDPFRRGSTEPHPKGEKSEGLGLGLFIAKHVVEAHGGSLEFESKNGRTRFVMSLPRTRRGYS